MSWNEMKPVKRQSLEQLALTLVLVGKHHHMCWILWLASSVQGQACSVPVTWKMYWNKLSLCLLLVFKVRS